MKRAQKIRALQSIFSGTANMDNLKPKEMVQYFGYSEEHPRYLINGQAVSEETFLAAEALNPNDTIHFDYGPEEPV
jgi:hypothetical protein